jgi:hypothetical protein
VACTFHSLSSLYCLDLMDCPLAICNKAANGSCSAAAEKSSYAALYSVASSNSSSSDYGDALIKLYNGCQALATEAACNASPEAAAVDDQVVTKLKGLAVTTISSSTNGTTINITTSDGQYTSVTNPDNSTTVTYPNGTYTYYQNVGRSMRH